MGMYVYRVTAERVNLSDGTQANVAKYAYKPWGDQKLNRECAMRSGCYASERIKPENLTDRIVIRRTDGTLGTEVYGNPRKMRTFLDDVNLGVPGRLPSIPDVRVVR